VRGADGMDSNGEQQMCNHDERIAQHRDLETVETEFG
jgi:hypothetical protein